MEELLRLTRENNQMLNYIIQYLHHNKRDDGYDFASNVIANLVSNRIDGGGYNI